MSFIDIHAYHKLSKKKAQQAADKLAADLGQKFEIDYGWDGDEIIFERPGVTGTIEVAKGEIRIQAQLGFLLGLLHERIESEVRRYLATHFGCTFER